MINRNEQDQIKFNLDTGLEDVKKRVFKSKKTSKNLVQYDTVLLMALELVFSVSLLGYIGLVIDSIWNIFPIGMIAGLILGFIVGIRLMCWNFCTRKHKKQVK